MNCIRWDTAESAALSAATPVMLRQSLVSRLELEVVIFFTPQWNLPATEVDYEIHFQYKRHRPP